MTQARQLKLKIDGASITESFLDIEIGYSCHGKNTRENGFRMNMVLPCMGLEGMVDAGWWVQGGGGLIACDMK